MAGKKRLATNDELLIENMLSLRDQKLTNAAISERLGVSLYVVTKRIGKTPDELTKAARQAGAAKTRAREQTGKKEPPQKPEKAPQSAPPASVTQASTVLPADAARPARPGTWPEQLPLNLFEFAIMGGRELRDERLKKLADFVLPEKWALPTQAGAENRKDTQVLEWYINGLYSFLANYYNRHEDKHRAFRFGGGVACFNTGLISRETFSPVYMVFKRNDSTRTQSGINYYCIGFFVNTAIVLRNSPDLPPAPASLFSMLANFDPSKPIKVHIHHLTSTPEKRDRYPAAIRDYWNLPLLIETAILYAQRLAAVNPGMACAAYLRGQENARILLPLYITNPNAPDVAVCLEEEGEQYLCRGVLTLNQAYLGARILGRPSAKWLLDVVNGE